MYASENTEKERENSQRNRNDHETWDPYYFIEKQDWNNNKPAIYVGGKSFTGKLRGNSITGKRVRKKVDYSDDGQE
jgi:hypothetical protein